MGNPGLKVGDRLRWLKRGSTHGEFAHSGCEVEVVSTDSRDGFVCRGPFRGDPKIMLRQASPWGDLTTCFEPLPVTPIPTINLAICHCCTRPNEYGNPANYPKSAPEYFRCGECRIIYGS